MMRRGDWQSRLSAYLVKRNEVPFRYGELDCGLFVAGAIEAMTAIDVAEVVRGRYANRREAFSLIRKLAGRSTVEAIAEQLAREYGLPQVPVLAAQRGDPVLLFSGSKSSLGIVAMYGTEIIQPGARELLRMPLSVATRAWHV